MKRKLWYLAVLAAFLVLLGTAANAGEKWRLATHGIVGTTDYRLCEVFRDTVNKLARGELEIELYGAGVLFPTFETFDNVANGVVEMGAAGSVYWTGKDPAFGLTSRPACPLNSFAEASYFEEKIEWFIEKLYAKHGITYLGILQVAPINEQLLSVVPITSVEDVKGKKIRSSGIGAQFYSALGATTVSVSAPELYAAFQTRNIDAAEWKSWDDNLRLGYNEVVTYVLEPALHNSAYGSMPLFVNPAKWEKLPQHLKNIVIAARDCTRHAAALTYIDEMVARQKWVNDPKIQIVRWSPEDEKKAREVGLRLIMEECGKTEDGGKYLEIYRDTLWELGYRDEAVFLGYKPK
ncbi:MAG: TRAP transporter substrate-binding protein DctP [Synergistaceae bacterium]|nr:TRAP transporter substrate-binding protein DctP [Synergistaceae bacterium]